MRPFEKLVDLVTKFNVYTTHKGNKYIAKFHNNEIQLMYHCGNYKSIFQITKRNIITYRDNVLTFRDCIGTEINLAIFIEQPLILNFTDGNCKDVMTNSEKYKRLKKLFSINPSLMLVDTRTLYPVEFIDETNSKFGSMRLSDSLELIFDNSNIFQISKNGKLKYRDYSVDEPQTIKFKFYNGDLVDYDGHTNIIKPKGLFDE